MERSAVLIAAGCALLLSVLPVRAVEEGWRLLRESDGISVYSREVAGSKYDEAWAQAVMTVRLSTLVGLILDGSSHSQWVDTVAESRQLERVSETEVYNYTLSGAPWPISDRDAVVLTRVMQDSESLVVTIHSSARPDHIAERDGVVRVPHVESTWTLVPRAAGTVEVNHRVHNDPGGAIPGWLMNSIVADQPYNTLAKLRALLGREQKYRDTALPYIEEPGS